MITMMLVGLLQLAAPSSPAPVDEVGGGDVIFTRVEPHLAAGARALAANDPDLALERYRRAEATSDEQRAVVEYNAGQALLMQAMQAAAAQQAPPSTAPSPPGQAAPAAPAAQPAAPPDVGDALSSFERAAALGTSPTFVSEARLAAGNAALVGNKLDDAIAQLRKALVADPRNERARRNLQRALELKQQQPPQQNNGDGEQNDQNDKGDKNDEQQQQQQQQGDKGEQKNDEQNNDEQNNGEQNSDEKNDASNKGDQADQQKPDAAKQNEQNSDDKKGDQGDKDQQADKDNGAPGADGAKPAPRKPTSREEARRLLEGVRSREKPLSPIEMRGTERRPAENGKDW